MPSETTEVRVLYDDKNLYLGIRAFDADPAKINARDLVRDSLFATDDRIEIILDTYHDRRNAFRFSVNPLGTQQDALITDEGRDVNLSWDGSWISAGRIDAKGYIVEIAIPLTTLRFTEGIEAWGLNISRIIRRKNEENPIDNPHSLGDRLGSCHDRFGNPAER
jgi:Carbohydrate family 9 binding domain-like